MDMKCKKCSERVIHWHCQKCGGVLKQPAQVCSCAAQPTEVSK